jgi:hypothetical protein
MLGAVCTRRGLTTVDNASDKIPNSHPAVARYVSSRYGEPELPDDYGKVHAVFYVEPGQATPLIWRWRSVSMKLLAQMKRIEYVEGWPPLDAACGARVRVILPMAFHLGEDNACLPCKRLAVIWAMDPEECIRQIQDRHDKRRQHEQIKADVADYHQRQATDLERKIKPQRDFGT